MPEPHWPRFSRVQQRVRWMRTILDRLDDETIAALLRIAGDSSRPLEEGAGTAVADGYPASSSGAGEGTTSSSSDTATERAALRDYRIDADGKFVGWYDPVDNVGESCSELFAQLAEAEGVLNRVDRQRDFVINNGATIKGRVSSLQGDCLCCERPVAGTPNDRLRAGFCSACDMAWRRAFLPDRSAFIAGRRKALRAEAEARNAHREQTAEQ